LPVAGLVLGVLVPVARLAGEADDDDVRPAVAVEVLGPAGEALAVVAQAVAVVAELADLVHLPGRRFVPGLAVDDVGPGVAVDVGDGHALGAEDLVEDRLLPADGFAGHAGVRFGIGNQGEGECQAHRGQGTEKPQARSHGYPPREKPSPGRGYGM